MAESRDPVKRSCDTGRVVANILEGIGVRSEVQQRSIEVRMRVSDGLQAPHWISDSVQCHRALGSHRSLERATFDLAEIVDGAECGRESEVSRDEVIPQRQSVRVL